MNYIDNITSQLATRFPEDDAAVLRLYTLLVKVAGSNITLENVHDAWAVWRADTEPDHPDIVPFHELTLENQERDRKYAVAIRDIATALQNRDG